MKAKIKLIWSKVMFGKEKASYWQQPSKLKSDLDIKYHLLAIDCRMKKGISLPKLVKGHARCNIPISEKFH